MYILVLAIIMLFSTSVFAQVPVNSLTPTQCATLKTHIFNNPATADIRSGNQRNDQAIADVYNTNASPDYWVFRHDLSKGEILFTKSVDSTSFTFVNTGFITRSQGERDAFSTLFGTDNKTNCGLPNVVQAFVDIFSGAATEAAGNRTHIQAMCREKASVIVKMFASNVGLATTCNGGTGTGVNSPCIKGFTGLVTSQQIACAMNLP